MTKSELIEDCPLCKLIEEGKVSSKGDRCCVLKWGVHRVAVRLSHQDLILADDFTEAFKLLKISGGKYVLKEFGLIAGHGGVEAVPAGEVASIGKSVVRKE